jgi:hypothetical protein
MGMFVNGIIDCWSLNTRFDNPYIAPECYYPSVCGKVYSHVYTDGRTGKEDGTVITTSAVNKTEKTPKGMVVTTLSGSRYLLGDPDPAYINYCEDNGYHVPTKDKPFRDMV